MTNRGRKAFAGPEATATVLIAQASVAGAAVNAVMTYHKISTPRQGASAAAMPQLRLKSAREAFLTAVPQYIPFALKRQDEDPDRVPSGKFSVSSGAALSEQISGQ